MIFSYPNKAYETHSPYLKACCMTNVWRHTGWTGSVPHFNADVNAHTRKKLIQYSIPSLGFIMQVVRWLLCDASVANHHHLLANGFSMCLAAYWLQWSQISESRNEARHCCAAAEKGTLSCERKT